MQLSLRRKTERFPCVFHRKVKDESHGFDLGAVDYITKPVSPPVGLRRVKIHLELYDVKRLLDNLVKERTAELDLTRLEIIQRLGRAAEYKDNETGMHVIRMSHYSKLLALKTGMNECEAEMLFNAAPMHDIGKIGIPDNILLKPGKLNADEWNVMKQHPQIGSDIIGKHQSVLLNLAIEIAITHHEKWDGSGYPKGLKGEDIPFCGRIVAITDVFDALTTKRPYKKAWAVEDAVNLIKSEAGKHFDANLVNQFIEILPSVLEIKEKYAEEQG